MGAELMPVIKTLALDQANGNKHHHSAKQPSKHHLTNEHPASNLVAKQPKRVFLALTESSHRLLDNPCQLGL